MKRSIAALIAITGLVILPAQAQLMPAHAPVRETHPQGQSPAMPVARVNGSVLTERDLLREMYQIFPYAKQHKGAFPKGMESEIRNGALQMIIFEELVYQDALRRKMTVTLSRMARAEKDFCSQFPTPEAYQEFVKTEFSGSQKDLRAKIRRSLLIDAFLQAEVVRKSKVSPAEAKAYYDKNPAPFEYPESFAFQTISILPPPNATPGQLKEGRERAEAAWQQARTAKTYEQFGILAEKLSDDDYRVVMGDHKFVDRAKLDPAVVRTMLSMKPGDVSGIIQVEQAQTFVRLIKHVPAGKMSFEQVKDRLVKKLEARKSEALRASIGQELRRKANVEVM